MRCAAAIALLLAALSASCSSVWSAAGAAAADPATWIPLGGAAVFALGDLDEDLSDWAHHRNPLFGNAHEAGEASDLIRDLVRYEAIVLESVHLVIARDQGNAAWIGPPLAGFSSAAVTGALVTQMKEDTEREQPDGADDLAFPSRHAAAVAVTAFAANEIWRRDFADSAWAGPVIVANGSLVALEAFLRLESGSHYPSDVLAGVAIGHFFGRFAHELIPASAQVEVTPVSIALILPFGGSR